MKKIHRWQDGRAGEKDCVGRGRAGWKNIGGRGVKMDDILSAVTEI